MKLPDNACPTDAARSTNKRARYAIYFVPGAESDLYRFGRSVLGYDCHTGEDVPLCSDFDLDAVSWRALTQEPRRYGFHATLKAPFHLVESTTEAQLTSAFLDSPALGQQAIRFEPEVRMLDGFVAITPSGPSKLLEALANQCTMTFDAFRAPMSAQERARRAASNLTQRQMRNLDRWGYPYVCDDYTFHMTLTGRLPVERSCEVLAALRQAFTRLCGRGWISVDRLALVKQEHEQARFRVLRQAGLDATAEPHVSKI